MNPEFPFLDPELPLEQRLDDLLGRMTLDEKMGQMVFDAPAIPRLSIPAYNWWNECLHGVGRAGLATVFPQAIGLGATWNTALVQQVAEVISDEARAKHHAALRQGRHDWYWGLTFWSPNINIFRDPRWGRGQETYGEDPTLTARMGVAFVKGLQGDHPGYLKVAATPKHYAVHSGPEHARHHFNALASQQDLDWTYLPAFKACIQEGKAESIMGAYNRTNGEPCCASPTLLHKILRQEWGFEGYVVSDCGAVQDIYTGHRVAADAAEAAALAVKAGCDLECGSTYSALPEAIERGLLDETDIDRAVRRLFRSRFRLGMFDPPERVPYASLPIEVVDSPKHRALALETARQSLVLLKNEGNLLPLSSKIRKLAVIGPNADDPAVLLGNYNGFPSQIVTPFYGILTQAGAGIAVEMAAGCGLVERNPQSLARAVDLAENSDVIIFVAGLSQQLEGEEGQEEGVAACERSLGDRQGLELPEAQEELLKAVHATGKPVILVLLNGSPIALQWASRNIPAILEAWYPGQAGGTAIGEAIFGKVNPGGRLPITFYASLDDLPAFEDYRMQGRTYRYFDGPVTYPFGWGLSYASFSYHHLEVNRQGQAIQVKVEVRNDSLRSGDEVVQVYLRPLHPGRDEPRLVLAAFTRLSLAAQESRLVSFEICLMPPLRSAEEVQVAVGGRQPMDMEGIGCDAFITGMSN
jgi:beta-glucosidase